MTAKDAGATEHEEPSHGEEYGPCAICGKTALPKFGHFLCRDHATMKHAKIVETGRYDELETEQ